MSKHTPKQQWFVFQSFGERRWFGNDETAARIYLQLLELAYGAKPGIHAFIGLDVPPPHIVALAKTTGSNA